MKGGNQVSRSVVVLRSSILDWGGAGGPDVCVCVCVSVCVCVCDGRACASQYSYRVTIHM